MAFAVAVAIAIAAALVTQWGELREAAAAARPSWGYIALSCALVLANYALLIQAWRILLHGWGGSLGFLDYTEEDLTGFAAARRIYGSRVEYVQANVYDLDHARLGTFDVVLFLGVLYHVKDPLTCLERMAAVTGECLVVETETAFDLIPWPVMRYYKRYELNDDPTNYWAPNKLCLTTMLQELGFTRFEIAPTPFHKQSWKRGRIIMHAFR